MKSYHRKGMTFESINFRFQLAYSDKIALRGWPGGSQPVFYLLYWQPLICNIAKILNRHRYLDPRSPGTRLRHLVSQLPLITDQLPTFSARSCVKYFSSLAHLSKFFANEIRLLFPTPSSTRSKVQSEKVELALHKNYRKWELIPQFFVLKLCGDHKGIKY